MENVLLVVHLILALMLIGVVLLQRSEGGALGMGGGGGGMVAGRGATSALAKLTWGLAGAFIITSIALTAIGGGRDTGDGSVIIEGGDGLLPPPPVGGALPGIEDLLPPPASLVPDPAPEVVPEPASEPASEAAPEPAPEPAPEAAPEPTPAE